MIKRTGRYFGILIIAIAAIVFVAWATSPDPKYNPASFEEEPLVQRIAPLDEAVTLAQYRNPNGKTATLQILGFSEEKVTGVDLVELGASRNEDPFLAFASVKASPIADKATHGYPTIEIAMTDLLPSGSSGNRHIGSGTNFPEHAEESNSDSVFQFPKFGPATPARTNVRAENGILLDYEVELCIRFDRDVTSAEDFDGAVKGLFLCGDFTNRNDIINLADPDNLDSGTGFSDAKSGPDFFPTGPFLVIPKDWQTFVKKLRMTTAVNGEPRQDARGAEMTLDFRQLAEKSLGDMSEARFLYKDGFQKLARDRRIDTSMTLMSGTSEGVIMTGPTRADIIEAVASYIFSGGPLAERSPLETAKRVFIRNELESGHFLQPGQAVDYRSNYLGNIEIQVIDAQL